jgi:hypothetical protein
MDPIILYGTSCPKALKIKIDFKLLLSKISIFNSLQAGLGNRYKLLLILLNSLEYVTTF